MPHPVHTGVAEQYRYVVKYDLATRTKTIQLPAVFTNLTDIHSSVDTGNTGELTG